MSDVYDGTKFYCFGEIFTEYYLKDKQLLLYFFVFILNTYALKMTKKKYL